MSSVVVVDDVSPVVRTGDVDRVRYRGSGVVGVPKTQHTILFVCSVGYVDRESQKSTHVYVADIYTIQHTQMLFNIIYHITFHN